MRTAPRPARRTATPAPGPGLAALAAVGALALAGCTAEAPQEPPETVTVTATAAPDDGGASPEPSPTDATEEPRDATDQPAEGGEPQAQEEAPFPADLQPDTAEPSADARLSPTTLRFGAHERYDRVVLELEGEGAPGWRAEYVEDPTQQAAGEPVYLRGDAYLMVVVEGVAYPTEEGAEPYEGPRSVTPELAGVVRDIRYGSLFEGKQELFLGLASRQPFRVFALEDPTRVVIDVQHP